MPRLDTLLERWFSVMKFKDKTEDIARDLGVPNVFVTFMDAACFQIYKITSSFMVVNIDILIYYMDKGILLGTKTS